jgi:PIN domain nuclease of toxin-antitoxin system
MNLLLDTHSLLWSLFSTDKLSPSAVQNITSRDNDVVVSVVTFWEISLKYSLGKLELSGVGPEELPEFAESMGFGMLLLSPKEAAGFHRLPRLSHKDPFDRLIIWQAIRNRRTLISKDREFKKYERFGLKVKW